MSFVEITLLSEINRITLLSEINQLLKDNYFIIFLIFELKILKKKNISRKEEGVRPTGGSKGIRKAKGEHMVHIRC